MSYVPELSSASSSSSSFIPSLSSLTECQTESISFKGITFIYGGRWPGLVSSTLLHIPTDTSHSSTPAALVSLLLHFLVLQAYFGLPPLVVGSALPVLPSTSFTAKPSMPSVLLTPEHFHLLTTL